MIGLLSDQDTKRVPIVGVRRSVQEFAAVDDGGCVCEKGLGYTENRGEVCEGALSCLRECPVTLRRADVALWGSLSEWAELRAALFRISLRVGRHLLLHVGGQSIQANPPILAA